MKRILQYIFKDTLAQYNGGEVLDKKVIVVIITSAVSLMMISYFGYLPIVKSYLFGLGYHDLLAAITSPSKYFPNESLFALFYGTVFRFFLYVVLPVVIIKLLFKESLSDYGLNISGVFSGYRIYIVFLLVMIPLVILVSTTDAFQDKYPFYNPAGEDLFPNFIIWQCFYFCQFFFVEFFFRGFLVHGTKHRLGFYSIFIMLIPYMMIHFNKPFLETSGAIIAGLFLGALSLRNNTIWQGVLIHYGVGLTMDLAALFQKGYFDEF